MKPLFDLPPNPSLAVLGEDAAFPIRRIFCVGQNYAEHAREMGADPAKGKSPIYFTKSAWATCGSGATVRYPMGTENCHFEMELVVALGQGPEGETSIYGYACGLDMTRRDLQAKAKEKGHPWDTAKDFAEAAILGPVTRAEEWGTPGEQTIRLVQNGETRQEARLADMIWPVPAILENLSGLYSLLPGDLIFTGTPAGVGPIEPGDVLEGTIDGLEPVRLTIAEAA